MISILTQQSVLNSSHVYIKPNQTTDKEFANNKFTKISITTSFSNDYISKGVEMNQLFGGGEGDCSLKLSGFKIILM